MACKSIGINVVFFLQNSPMFFGYWQFIFHDRPSQALVCSECDHYIDVIMTTMASQITSLTVVYSTVYSDADQRKHQSFASLAFVWGIHRDRWIPHTKGQWRGKCFHLMTSSCTAIVCTPSQQKSVAFSLIDMGAQFEALISLVRKITKCDRSTNIMRDIFVLCDKKYPYSVAQNNVCSQCSWVISTISIN